MRNIHVHVWLFRVICLILYSTVAARLSILSNEYPLSGYGQRDILSQFYQLNADGATEPVRPVTSFFAMRVYRVAFFGHF